MSSIAGQSHMFAPAAGYAALTAEQRKVNKSVERKLIEAIVEDPEVEHPTNISVFSRQESGTTHVHIIGKLANQKEKDRVEEIVAKNTPVNTVIINEAVLD